jgi:hypothetical protein
MRTSPKCNDAIIKGDIIMSYFLQALKIGKSPHPPFRKGGMGGFDDI